MQVAILDFFDFHAILYGQSDISTQNVSSMNRFLKLLEKGATQYPTMPTVCA